ncbi:hypothetical protein JT251_05525 [Helicobacter pylori]|nr:hypothetical protein [Helicobacter pylori]
MKKFFLVFFITNDKRACQKQAIILKMKKSFLAFFILFSGKLVANLSDSFKKALLYIGGVKLEIKRVRMISNASYLFKRIK